MAKTRTHNRGTNIKLCKSKNKKLKTKRPELTKFGKQLQDAPQKGKRRRLRKIPSTVVESLIGVNFYIKKKYIPPNKKRLIFIDGSNVAYAHANNERFSPEGIDIAVRYFTRKGHEVKVVLPDFRENPDDKIMGVLKKDNHLILTPSKNFRGKGSLPYDDRFAMKLAVEFDGVVISNDFYRDLLQESDEFRNLIETRVIGYTFCEDMFALATDPYGPNNTGYEQILNRN